jgi:hypothetical protein
MSASAAAARLVRQQRARDSQQHNTGGGAAAGADDPGLLPTRHRLGLLRRAIAEDNASEKKKAASWANTTNTKQFIYEGFTRERLTLEAHPQTPWACEDIGQDFSQKKMVEISNILLGWVTAIEKRQERNVWTFVEAYDVLLSRYSELSRANPDLIPGSNAMLWEADAWWNQYFVPLTDATNGYTKRDAAIAERAMFKLLMVPVEPQTGNGIIPGRITPLARLSTMVANGYLAPVLARFAPRNDAVALYVAACMFPVLRWLYWQFAVKFIGVNDAEQRGDSTDVTMGDGYEVPAYVTNRKVMTDYENANLPAAKYHFLEPDQEILAGFETMAKRCANQALGRVFNAQRRVDGWSLRNSEPVKVKAQSTGFAHAKGGAYQVTMRTQINLAYDYNAGLSKTDPTRRMLRSELLGENVESEITRQVEDYMEIAKNVQDLFPQGLVSQELLTRDAILVAPARTLYMAIDDLSVDDDDDDVNPKVYYTLWLSQAITIAPHDSLYELENTASNVAAKTMAMAMAMGVGPLMSAISVGQMVATRDEDVTMFSASRTLTEATLMVGGATALACLLITANGQWRTCKNKAMRTLLLALASGATGYVSEYGLPSVPPSLGDCFVVNTSTAGETPPETDATRAKGYFSDAAAGASCWKPPPKSEFTLDKTNLRGFNVDLGVVITRDGAGVVTLPDPPPAPVIHPKGSVLYATYELPDGEALPNAFLRKNLAYAHLGMTPFQTKEEVKKRTCVVPRSENTASSRRLTETVRRLGEEETLKFTADAWGVGNMKATWKTAVDYLDIPVELHIANVDALVYAETVAGIIPEGNVLIDDVSQLPAFVFNVDIGAIPAAPSVVDEVPQMLGWQETYNMLANAGFFQAQQFADLLSVSALNRTTLVANVSAAAEYTQLGYDVHAYNGHVILSVVPLNQRAPAEVANAQEGVEGGNHGSIYWGRLRIPDPHAEVANPDFEIERAPVPHSDELLKEFVRVQLVRGISYNRPAFEEIVEGGRTVDTPAEAAETIPTHANVVFINSDRMLNDVLIAGSPAHLAMTEFTANMNAGGHAYALEVRRMIGPDDNDVLILEGAIYDGEDGAQIANLVPLADPHVVTVLHTPPPPPPTPPPADDTDQSTANADRRSWFSRLLAGEHGRMQLLEDLFFLVAFWSTRRRQRITVDTTDSWHARALVPSAIVSRFAWFILAVLATSQKYSLAQFVSSQHVILVQIFQVVVLLMAFTLRFVEMAHDKTLVHWERHTSTG